MTMATTTTTTTTTMIKSQVFHNFLPIRLPTKTTPKFLSLSFNPKARKSQADTAGYMAMAAKWHSLKANHNHSFHNEDLPPSLSAKLEETKGIEKGGKGITASIGVAVMMMMVIGIGDDKAWALGPEGPLVEEFWENVRRYALYALTVSTGVIYTVFQPIFELLKNPISALLIIIIIGGSIFIVSQILSAMVGVSDFNYDYSY